MKKTVGIISIAIGAGILGLWGMLLITGNVPELVSAPISITFHLIAELSMGILMLISGIALLKASKWSSWLFVLSSGLVIYAVINSAGYYGQFGNWPMVMMFMGLLGITIILNILIIRSELKH